MKLPLISLAILGTAFAWTKPYCPTGWTFENETAACYYISQQLMVFDDAVDYCSQLGSKLTTISSYYDRKPIADLVSPLVTTVWIGARRVNGTFKNIDGSYFSSSWLPGEPSNDGDCVTQRGVSPIGMRAIPCYSLQPAFCTQEASTCNGGSFGSLYTRTGNITSPNYPDHYFNNLDCLYLITSTNGTYITINFSPYFVENYDYVDLYDGNSTSSKYIGTVDTFWYYKTSFESTGNQLLVRFRTDKQGTDHGWLATWNAKLFQPDIRQTGQTGNFTSPNYPNVYPAYTEQLYFFSGTFGFKLNLTFTDFYTEKRYDPVLIYDSYYVNPSKLIANFSGNYLTTPPSVVSNSSYLTMKFTSDGSNQYKGFSGYWRIV